MSLVQHVSSLEGVDHEPEVEFIEEPLAPIRRRISYDVIQPPCQGADLEQIPGTPAYKHSAVKRFAQVIFTVLACWLASGIVFGFAALKPVLIAERVYHDQCTEQELHDDLELCAQQDLRLNLFFTVASITANVSALPVGTILDRYGPRICGLIGCLLLMLGSVLMSVSFNQPTIHGLLVGNFFLALSGTFVFVPSFQVANAFPRYTGSIVALVTGAFDASAAVFLFYRFAYEASHRSFTPDQFFLCYLAVPVLVVLPLVAFMPRHGYDSTLTLEGKIERAQDAASDMHESDAEIGTETERQCVRRRRAERRRKTLQQIDVALGGVFERRQRARREQSRQQNSQVWGVLHGVPAYRQMATPWFILITLMTVLQMIRMNYFIATIRAQYLYMLGSNDQAGNINSFFDVALPVGGILFTPFIGVLLDRLRVATMLGLIVVLTTVIGILNSVPTVWAGYLTVGLFVLLRPLYYSAMSDYATKVFGFATFGRVYGTIICLSGLANFSQYALDTLTHRTFHENPLPINASLTVGGFVVGVALVSFVVQAGQQPNSQDEDERRPLIGGMEEEEEEDGSQSGE